MKLLFTIYSVNFRIDPMMVEIPKNATHVKVRSSVHPDRCVIQFYKEEGGKDMK